MKEPRYRFSSRFSIGRHFGDFAESVVQAEPMFFSAEPAYAHAHGGPITRAFVSAFMAEHPELADERVVIDTKVAMLMPGWFPCIPGWHHDDVPRSSPDKQPNYDTPEYRAQHVMGLVNGAICPTEFAVGDADFCGVPDGQLIYRAWHRETEEAIRLGRLSAQSVPSERLIYFDDRALHQGVQALRGGWRWFGRASWNTLRPISNTIRHQNQVYLAAPFEGW